MNRIEVKVWLLRNGYTTYQIARELGADPTLISHILAGRIKGKGPKGRLVIQWLRDHGCPEELLEEKEEVAA